MSQPSSSALRPSIIGALVGILAIAAFGFVGTQSARSQPLPTEPPGGEVTTSRLAGDSRFGTAVEISQYEFPDGADTVFLARADAFPDALAGGALTGGPILLVPQCDDIPEVVTDEISRLSPTDVIALGGEAAICEDVLDQAGEAAANDGPDPSETPTGSEFPLPTTFPSETMTPSESPSPSPSESDPEPLPTFPGPTPTETETPAS